MTWNRVAELYVGTFKDAADPTSGYEVGGLHFDFDVTRSYEFYRDSAEFTIWNPNETTLAEVMRCGVAVVFRAGHEDQGVGNVFVGQIAKAYAEDMTNGDVALRLLCNSRRGAQYRLSRVMMTLSEPSGTTYYAVLKDVADFVGVPLSGAAPLRGLGLKRAHVDTGTVRDVVANFTRKFLRPLGGRVLLTNNEMLYVAADNSLTFETAYLNYGSGLIRAVRTRDETWVSSEDAFLANMEYYMGLTGSGNNDAAQPEPSRDLVEFEAVLNPNLCVGKPVHIDARRSSSDSRNVCGKYWVKELRFSGDNYGGDFIVSGTAEDSI